MSAAAQPCFTNSTAAALARCDREIAEIRERPDVASGAAPAWLVTLGMEDWHREREIILTALPVAEWPYRWAWRARPLRRLDEVQSRYYNWPCRVVARARRMNTVHIEFPDGFVAITSANGLRKRHTQTNDLPVGGERQCVAARGATGKPGRVLSGVDRRVEGQGAQDSPSVAPPTLNGVNAGSDLRGAHHSSAP